ncbi:MAG TPA: tryptophan halogenase family protein [Rhizomicrobium sp.]|nr:tryptophan halogenase family protein [Rhizomicrobium sp.]
MGGTELLGDTRLRSIAIVGGGVAGWMAAAALSRLVKSSYCSVRVIEHPAATPLGRAEGTIPALQRFHNLLGIDERAFLRKTAATFKLGIEFAGWMRAQESFFHTFCEFGGTIAQVPFHHHWLRLRAAGERAGIDAYSIATVAARLGRFERTSPDRSSPLSLFSYAYHVDAALYADFLRDYATARGVERIAATAVDAELHGSDGFVAAVVLDDHRRIEGDFFIDCTGLPGLVMERVLKTGIEDWSRWLPCDRAVAAERPNGDAIPVHTRIDTAAAGWRWSIPLSDRTDCGYAYASAFASDDDALQAVPGASTVRRFVNGRPKKFWNRNCLALPGGFVEPLEANTVHLIQTGILRFVSTFPDRTCDPLDAAEYDRLAATELERVRDFLILHYATAGRDDTPFWRHCRAMEVPDTVRRKIALFRGSGKVAMLDGEHFAEHSWVSLMLGHDIVPRAADPLAEIAGIEEVRRHSARMAETIRAAALSMPLHRQYLAAAT